MHFSMICAALHVCSKHQHCVHVWQSLQCDDGFAYLGCAYPEGCTYTRVCVLRLQVTACSSDFLVTEHCSPDQHFQLVSSVLKGLYASKL